MLFERLFRNQLGIDLLECKLISGMERDVCDE